MRLLLGVGALALVAGCGASSAGSLDQVAASGAPSDHRLAPPPTTPAPASSVPVPVPVRTAAASPVRVTAVSATAGTATAGPGRVSSPAASPSPRPTPSAVAGTVTVTDEDSGTTVRLAGGQHLRVRLSQGTWDPPVSSADKVVVRRSSTGGYPSDQPVDAMFDAAGAGTADVTAQSDAACFHTEPRCMMAQREWRVTVVVS
jgi:hypothetical protein